MTGVSSPALSLSIGPLVKQAARRAGLADRVVRLSGLPPPVQALTVALRAFATPLVVVVPTDAAIEPFVADTRFFMEAFEGLSPAAVEQAVLPFPSPEVDPYRGLAPHFDVASARARALHALASGTARVIVASAEALPPRMSAPARLLAASIDLRPASDVAPTALADLLADAGFTREDPVDQHGEFSVRGGIVDVFPAGEARPVRLEFVGDSVESIRRYDPATQRSTETIDQVSLVPVVETFDTGPDASFFDYVAQRGDVRTIVVEPDEVAARVRGIDEQMAASHRDAIARGQNVPEPAAICLPWDTIATGLAGALAMSELVIDEASGAAGAGEKARAVRCTVATGFRGRLQDWVADIRQARDRGDTVLCIVNSAGRAERTVELLAEYDLIAVHAERAESTAGAPVLVATGQLSRGFRLADAALQVYAEADVFEEERQVRERRRQLARSFLSDFRDLKIGDFVVHVDHGIGRFVGLKKIGVGQETHEFMELRYAGDDKLFVPVERLDLVQKYVGGGHAGLDRLGGTTWEKAKSRVKKAMRDMADELLKLYAARKAVSGHAFGPDTHWQEEFEGAFEYDLTADQITAVADIKRDMESATPMDRLLCGDVGYGKTEVAMRAAFKCVLDGKQVAVLAPTTVLAFQHFKTFSSRFAAFPVSIDMVSRFRSTADQRQVLQAVAAGKVDIIIGTHRLLSKDVAFRDLGLLVVDEEQRFGVAHKERIKQMRRKVDVLTLTATPIPRTLNMSLVGIRDMSVIETPPRDRLSIQTHVVKFDQAVIASAIRHEIDRGGQVYFVHNRVESIGSVAALLRRLVPEASLAVGHGQMHDESLERVMVEFVNRKHDVLVATTIIENGLDIANANTIIVNRADRYGLAQLYQLRGRVGRSDRRAYAYLLIPPEDGLSPVARKRLSAIREFSDLGSGFRVAALDLEIRGAGNLLGGEQSGHIEAIGFEMYMKLLEEAVRELKGEELEEEPRTTVNLKVDIRIDDAYIPDMNQRLAVYRRIAQARSEDELAGLVDELRDRYGPLAESVLVLAGHARIRILAERLRVETIDREASTVVYKLRQDAPLDPTRLLKLLERRREVRLMPPATLLHELRLPLAAPGYRGMSPSWWTARARAGEVTPGFSKDAILRTTDESPVAPGGLYDRVGELLEALVSIAE